MAAGSGHVPGNITPVSFASITKRSKYVPPSKAHGIIIETIESIPTEEYIYALEKIITNTQAIDKCQKQSNGRLTVYFTNTTTPEQLTKQFKTIEVCNNNIKIRPIITASKRIVISNACPTIPHEAIETKLKELGLTITSEINFLRAGFKRPGFTHILSFRRYVYISSDFEILPETAIIEYEGIKYRIFISDDSKFCTYCKRHGHIVEECKFKLRNEQNSNNSTTKMPTEKRTDQEHDPLTNISVTQNTNQLQPNNSLSQILNENSQIQNIQDTQAIDEENDNLLTSTLTQEEIIQTPIENTTQQNSQENNQQQQNEDLPEIETNTQNTQDQHYETSPQNEREPKTLTTETESPISPITETFTAQNSTKEPSKQTNHKDEMKQSQQHTKKNTGTQEKPNSTQNSQQTSTNKKQNNNSASSCKRPFSKSVSTESLDEQQPSNNSKCDNYTEEEQDTQKTKKPKNQQRPRSLSPGIPTEEWLTPLADVFEEQETILNMNQFLNFIELTLNNNDVLSLSRNYVDDPNDLVELMNILHTNTTNRSAKYRLTRTINRLKYQITKDSA